MKILAIETTGHFASVALNGKQIKNEAVFSHLEEIVPMCMEMLKKEGLSGKDLDAIAVSKGPGSFTGIRIGLATAKGLAQIWQKPILCIPTLESFACRKDCGEDFVIPVFDARRNQVFGGIYKNGKTLLAGGAYDLDFFMRKIDELADGPAKFYGDGTGLIGKESLGEQEALQLMPLAEQYFKEEKLDTCYSAAPDYMRMAEAERKLEEKKRAGK